MNSSLKYHNGKVELKINGKIIPPEYIIDPMILEISGHDLPRVKFELLVNDLQIDELTQEITKRKLNK